MEGKGNSLPGREGLLENPQCTNLILAWLFVTSEWKIAFVNEFSSIPETRFLHFFSGGNAVCI